MFNFIQKITSKGWLLIVAALLVLSLLGGIFGAGKLTTKEKELMTAKARATTAEATVEIRTAEVLAWQNAAKSTKRIKVTKTVATDDKGQILRDSTGAIAYNTTWDEMSNNNTSSTSSSSSSMVSIGKGMTIVSESELQTLREKSVQKSAWNNYIGPAFVLDPTHPTIPVKVGGQIGGRYLWRIGANITIVPGSVMAGTNWYF